MREAGRTRLRPILMTSFATIAGILPIAIGFGAGAESRRPMGVGRGRDDLQHVPDAAHHPRRLHLLRRWLENGSGASQIRGERHLCARKPEPEAVGFYSGGL